MTDSPAATRPILVLNCGSSSIKYQIIDADDEQVLATGLVQKIGDASPGTIDHTVFGEGEPTEVHLDLPLPDHGTALAKVVELFDEHGPDLAQVQGVAHRVVHGGRTFSRPERIDDAVITRLTELAGVAPLHNPPAVAGITAAMAALPDVEHVAVFDTGFFHDLPLEAQTYAIDTALAAELGIRRYGFHGTSHDYVAHRAAETLGRPLDELRMIVCHLGNGASVSALRDGVPIETSMGLTPLQGLVMGTRSGDVDAGLPAFLARHKGWDVDQIDDELNKRSGMLGLTGKTDMREVLALVDAGDEPARLGVDVYVHRIISYVGSYTAHLGGLDVLVFTAGVGENSSDIRQRVIDRLAPFGVVLDRAANEARSKQARVISSPESSVIVMVVPTNEELQMAREVSALLG